MADFLLSSLPTAYAKLTALLPLVPSLYFSSLPFFLRSIVTSFADSTVTSFPVDSLEPFLRDESTLTSSFFNSTATIPLTATTSATCPSVGFTSSLAACSPSASGSITTEARCSGSLSAEGGPSGSLSFACSTAITSSFKTGGGTGKSVSTVSTWLS